ncbi:MAG: insulinase family protein [Bacteroidales bacterium]|jgi:predicted Zn-dependent peptidase|nr:insulinase family protein [Bacteroidales bacterium]
MANRIPFSRHLLANGLRVIVHEDPTTPLVSCNIVYHVGSINENPEMTGMAHLMEHYMFCGSKNIANFDAHLQKVGAINNAYTTQDFTHYYITLPAQNLETALWLESDRMLELAFQQQQLDIQKQVVMEEFKENFLNCPYGDLWMIFNNLVYEKHPYKWLPIGKELSHIEKVTMDDIKKFFYTWYRPNNAVIAISGNIKAEETFALVEKWFGDIPASAPAIRQYAQESEQLSPKKMEVERPVPSDMLLIGWKMCSRLHPDYYAYDLLSDLLGSGQSSLLYNELITKRHIFTDISAYISETFDPGLFIVGGRPAEGISLDDANQALTELVYHLDIQANIEENLLKVKNRVRSILLRGEIKIEDRSAGLAVAETLRAAEDFENEINQYQNVTGEQLQQCATSLFRKDGANTLFYRMGE